MKILFILLFTISFSFAKWNMHSSSTGEVFLFNNETGETFRYFDQDGNTGFTKQNFYRSTNLKNKNANKVQTTQTTTKESDNKQTDLQKIQNLLLNNGAANPVNLLNGIYQ
jgi:hypothetical protein